MTITGKHDVYEFLVDGQSGLIPGDVSGKAIIAGVCSKGEVGKAYRLGAKSPVRDLLGLGPLADAVEDAFAGAAAAGNQNSILIAVPVAGTEGGYIGPVTHTGHVTLTAPMPRVTGYPSANANIVVEVVTEGVPGIATVRTSTNGGKSWNATAALPLNGQLTITEAGGAGTGITFTFAQDKELPQGATWHCTVRLPIGPVLQTGPGPEVVASGTVLAGAEVHLLITRQGKCNEGQYQLSLDGGDTFGLPRTLPLEGVIKVPEAGITLALAPGVTYEVGTLYTVTLLPPVPTITTVMQALERPLERLDPEFVHVVGPTDAVDWAAFAMLAQGQLERHRPMFLTCESRLPNDGENLDAWADWLLDEKAKGAAPYVSCCPSFGEIMNRAGQRQVRNAGGLLVGKLISIPVQRHIGRVLDGPITPLTLPSGWSDALQVNLRDAGFITVQWYEGLNGAYWGDDKVMAEIISDFQFLTVLRVVFKALRLMRIQALKSMFDEAGDPLLESEAAGLHFLKENLEASLDVMVRARPRELIAGLVDIPTGQDIVNNGVDCEVTLIGIPIIKRIRLFTKYVYAGGRFDPRADVQKQV
ncbi:DUF2586 family protein [Desulfovibrio cuneatus]|uniref:DUF2586 family protein n=1 Tax=Desulfovibrio cuneatus TaxID=159728 RepID=UPI0003F9BDEC|nr:DUF2586 family protein [Desulfovibrio cuneatus]